MDAGALALPTPIAQSLSAHAKNARGFIGRNVVAGVGEGRRGRRNSVRLHREVPLLKEPRTVRLRVSRQRCTVIARTGGHRPRFLVRIRPSKVAAFGGHSFGIRVSRDASANRKTLRYVRNTFNGQFVPVLTYCRYGSIRILSTGVAQHPAATKAYFLHWINAIAIWRGRASEPLDVAGLQRGSMYSAGCC